MGFHPERGGLRRPPPKGQFQLKSSGSVGDSLVWAMGPPVRGGFR